MDANTYLNWRASRLVPPALRETGPAPPPSEQLLQQVWLHQRLERDALRTLDGQPVLILHPGFRNREAGPDFCGAIVQVGSESPLTGDVELDIRPENWFQHRHDRNPAYANVCLHVVWEAGAGTRVALPTLALKERLDASLSELETWLGHDSDLALPAHQAGLCSVPLRRMSVQLLRELVSQAALARLEMKARQLEARARLAGAGQALWEGLFVALGYKHNIWPMRRLAELLPRLGPRTTGQALSVEALQARLLGVAGLLPPDLTRSRARTDRYIRRIWDFWWRDRDAYADCLLPRAAWRFHGLRPANHPQRRLALASYWLADSGWIERLESWLDEDVPNAALSGSLLLRLQVEHDPFWSWHWTLRAAPMAEPCPLLGAQRATDLAVNVVLPWLWMRAETAGDPERRRRVEQRYFAWPAGEDNAVLKLGRQRLLGGAASPVPRTAAMQQGLIQILRDFCDFSDALCRDCRFPELVGNIGPG